MLISTTTSVVEDVAVTVEVTVCRGARVLGRVSTPGFSFQSSDLQPWNLHCLSLGRRIILDTSEHLAKSSEVVADVVDSDDLVEARVDLTRRAGLVDTHLYWLLNECLDYYQTRVFTNYQTSNFS